MLASCSARELTASIDDPSPDVARAAIGRLVELEGADAEPVLEARLLESDLSIVADIARALKPVASTRTIELAVSGLSEDVYTRRLAAARVLGLIGDRSAIGPLRRALEDEVAGVRVEVLGALAKLRAGDAAADCARRVSDPCAQVRLAAVRTAVAIGDPGVVLEAAAGDSETVVRLEVAHHLGRLPALVAAALLADPDAQVREAGARSAGIRQLDALAGLLRTDSISAVRRAAARRLGELGADGVEQVALISGIEDRDAIVRAAVLRGLEQALGRPGAIERLIAELASRRPERRRAAVFALGRARALEASCDVWRLADDPDLDVRLALILVAADVLPDPEPLLRYMATDPNSAVRHSALSRVRVTSAPAT